MTYLQSLSAELGQVGISGRLRRRILAEIEDHLACNRDAALGEPEEIARQFADELGTARARRGAFAAFGALALAGILFVVAFLTYGALGLRPAYGHAESAPLGTLGILLATIGGQVALIAGVLAAARAFRRRGTAIVPRAEATVIGRRALVGLQAGLAAMAGLALVALEFHRGVHPWWTTAALIAAGVGACVLAAAAPTVLASLRVRPTASGEAGDIFDDIGEFVPPILNGRPWAFALTVAGVIAVAITVVGVSASDPYDGALRGLGDGLACLAGFALLGRYLGLWGAARSAERSVQ